MKLLLALAGISLIPPIAAYFTLINNPRISFALRVNKYEAQQGLTAQKLQADLQAIGSAVQESLNESYRIKVEPKERADAERQRRLANSAVRSGALAFEKICMPSPSLSDNKRARPRLRANLLTPWMSAKRNS